MDLATPVFGRYIRILAVISLFLGLSDAARLLGVGTGSASPIAALGVNGFILLGVFCLARLFAAVGLWIRASWGAVLLVGATAAEIALYLMGNPDVRMGAFGLGVRVVLLAAILAIIALALRRDRVRAQE